MTTTRHQLHYHVAIKEDDSVVLTVHSPAGARVLQRDMRAQLSSADVFVYECSTSASDCPMSLPEYQTAANIEDRMMGWTSTRTEGKIDARSGSERDPLGDQSSPD